MNKKNLVLNYLDLRKRQFVLKEKEQKQIENELIYEKYKSDEKFAFEKVFNDLKDKIELCSSELEKNEAEKALILYETKFKGRFVEKCEYVGIIPSSGFMYIFKMLDYDNNPIRLLFVESLEGYTYNQLIWNQRELRAWNKLWESKSIYDYHCEDKETGEQWQLMGDDETGKKFIFRHRRLNGKREYFEVDKSSLDRENEQVKAFELLKKINYDRYMKTPCYLDKKHNKYWFKYVPNNDGNWESFSIDVEEKTEQQKAFELLHKVEPERITTGVCNFVESKNGKYWFTYQTPNARGFTKFSINIDQEKENVMSINKQEQILIKLVKGENLTESELREIVRLVRNDQHKQTPDFLKGKYNISSDAEMNVIYEIIGNELLKQIQQGEEQVRSLAGSFNYHIAQDLDMIHMCLKYLHDKNLISWVGNKVYTKQRIEERRANLIKQIQELTDEEDLERLEEALNTEDSDIPF